MLKQKVTDYFSTLSHLMLSIEVTDRQGTALSLEQGTEKAVQMIVDFITGPFGRLLAIIAVIALGFLAFAGRLSWFTAGAVVLLNNLHLPINAEVGQWLRARVHAQGGFVAVPDAPIPDLLSPATALHALAALDVRLTEEQTERCLDFVDSLLPEALPVLLLLFQTQNQALFVRLFQTL